MERTYIRNEECQKFLNDLELLPKEKIIEAVSKFFDQTDKEATGNMNDSKDKYMIHEFGNVKRTLLNRLKIIVNHQVRCARKSTEELKKLNTKNLLRFYRAERKRYNVAISQYHWGFDAVDYMWDHSDDEYYQKEKIKYDEWKDFLLLIKAELNSREHVF